MCEQRGGPSVDEQRKLAGREPVAAVGSEDQTAELGLCQFGQGGFAFSALIFLLHTLQALHQGTHS